MRIEQVDWDETQVEAYLQRQQIELEQEQVRPPVPIRQRYCGGDFNCECLSCIAWRAS